MGASARGRGKGEVEGRGVQLPVLIEERKFYRFKKDPKLEKKEEAYFDLFEEVYHN